MTLKLFAKINSARKKVAARLFILPASGKSSAVVNSLKKKYGAFEFDNDEIKKLLPGYDEYGAAYVHSDSKAVQKNALNAFKAGGEFNGANLAIPIIGSKMQDIEMWVPDLQDAGYDVHYTTSKYLTKRV